MIDIKYFKEYRELLGFTNQNSVKAFFGAKDIIPTVDYNYIDLLNSRLFEIIKKIDFLLPQDVKYGDINYFKSNIIDKVFEKLKQNEIISKLNNHGRRIEVQSGFQGINDIKQHKVLEAKKNKRDSNISSIVMHFDFFNGQVAFVKIDDVEDDNINWITRTQMEGQMVFNIDQNSFI